MNGTEEDISGNARPRNLMGRYFIYQSINGHNVFIGVLYIKERSDSHGVSRSVSIKANLLRFVTICSGASWMARRCMYA